jgi:hypothetical protein
MPLRLRYLNVVIVCHINGGETKEDVPVKREQMRTVQKDYN